MVQAASTTTHPVQRGLLSRTFSAMIRVVVWLFVALLFSIIVEWLGMAFFWAEQGVEHSRSMLVNEIAYLGNDFYRSVVTSSPARFAENIAGTFYYWLFEWTHVVDLIHWLSAPGNPQDSRLHVGLRSIYQPISAYVIAAMTISQVFAVRLAVLALAMPAFFLLGLVGVTDGLVERDLRKWGGGRESAYKYHHAKRAITPSLILVWIIYLAMPVSIHPSLIILPFAILFAVALAVSAGTFKKYL